jgi:hypothetical protein
MQFMAVKFARLKELLSGKEAKNESITDTLTDLANYADLMNIYLNDRPCKFVGYINPQPEPQEAWE